MLWKLIKNKRIVHEKIKPFGENKAVNFSGANWKSKGEISNI
jgi:hypothetical protein